MRTQERVSLIKCIAYKGRSVTRSYEKRALSWPYSVDSEDGWRILIVEIVARNFMLNLQLSSISHFSKWRRRRRRRCSRKRKSVEEEQNFLTLLDFLSREKYILNKRSLILKKSLLPLLKIRSIFFTIRNCFTVVVPHRSM